MKYLLLIITMCFFCSAHTDSKRIEVYAAGLTYWDVRPGETLGEIVSQLLPNNQARRKSLQAEIIKLNPAAFSDYNADFLKANVRLWLPGHSQGLNRKINKDKYSIREFSWGYIQTRKQY